MELGIPFLETSMKSDINIEEAIVLMHNINSIV